MQVDERSLPIKTKQLLVLSDTQCNMTLLYIHLTSVVLMAVSLLADTFA